MFAQSPQRRLLAGLLVAATALGGCGRDDKPAAAASGPSCERPGVPFSVPVTRLKLRVQDASPGQVERTWRIICDRLLALGIEHRVRTTAHDVVVDTPLDMPILHPPGSTGPLSPGRLAIYDWEVNVIGPGGSPAPHDPTVTGGQAAGRSGAISLPAAVLRAAKRPAEREPGNARAGSRFFAVDAEARRVFVDEAAVGQLGSPTRAAALATVSTRGHPVRIYEVKPGTVIVRAAQAGEIDDAWYVLRDDVAVRRSEIQSPHFAIVVDDALLSVLDIDSERDPIRIDGLSGSQIPGGPTIAGGRELAVPLGREPLPAALKIVESRDLQ